MYILAKFLNKQETQNILKKERTSFIIIGSFYLLTVQI